MVLRLCVLVFRQKGNVKWTTTHLGLIEKLDWNANSTCHGCGIVVGNVAVEFEV